MKTCIECRYSITNDFNTDIKCKKHNIHKLGESECCAYFIKKLTERELYLLEFYRKNTICIKEYEKYTGLKKQIFEELIENGCITGKGIDRPSHCYVQEDKFKKNYPSICAHNRQDR